MGTSPDRRHEPKRHGLPLYRQVKETLLQRLAEEFWRPGQLLPSEPRLAAEFGVSQGTMRRALDDLARQGLLARHQGRGTSVPIHDSHRALFHFFHLVDEDDARQLAESSAIAITVGSSLRNEYGKLGLRKNQQVIRITRVRYLGSRARIFERIVLSRRLFDGLEKTPLADIPNTIYGHYQRRFNISVVNAVERIRAVAAEPEEARHLDVATGTPLLEIERVAHTHRQQPIELRISRCLTDRYHYLNVLD